MGIIQTLADEVINCLAAGEVVEKPASVLKELVENSLDAGATEIDVSILGGGANLIRVTDNGHGMNAEDAVHCFGRHATSKLRHFDEMLTLSSLGFRGEALAAIASVSRIRLCTRIADSEMGTEIILEGGTIQSVKEIGVPVGTRLEVKDLFFNTPARLKFLKKETTEGKWLEEYLKALALSAPQTAFRFSTQGKPKWQMTSDASWCAQEEGPDPERVIACLGENVREALLPFVSQTDALAVCGFLVGPSTTRRDTKGIRLMVNGRWVADRDLVQTIKAAYRPYLEHGRFPMCVLQLTIPPERVDFNAHPQKTEIRITNRREIQSSLVRLITVFLVTQKPQTLLELKRDPTTYTLKNKSSETLGVESIAHARDWFPSPDVYHTTATEQSTTARHLEQPQSGSDYHVVSLLFDRFALLKRLGTWWLFDVKKHLHQMRRERFEAQQASGTVQRQRLLFPEQITTTVIKPDQCNEFEEWMGSYGFDITLFEENHWMIKAVPLEAGDTSPKWFFESMIEIFKSASSLSPQACHEKIMVLLENAHSEPLTEHLVANELQRMPSLEKITEVGLLRPIEERHLQAIFKASS